MVCSSERSTVIKRKYFKKKMGVGMKMPITLNDRERERGRRGIEAKRMAQRVIAKREKR